MYAWYDVQEKMHFSCIPLPPAPPSPLRQLAFYGTCIPFALAAAVLQSCILSSYVLVIVVGTVLFLKLCKPGLLVLFFVLIIIILCVQAADVIMPMHSKWLLLITVH